MTAVSIIKAAKLASVSRKTLYKYIEDGKISSAKNRFWKVEIEVVELIRVFGELTGDMSPDVTGDTKVTSKVTKVTPQDSALSIETLVDNARLKAENSQLRERLDEARQDKEKLDARLSEALASVKLLTHAPQEAGKEKKGLWARLMGR